MKTADEQRSDFFDHLDVTSTVASAKSNVGISVLSLINSFFRSGTADEKKAE